MSEVPPGKKRAVSDDSNTAQTVGWKLLLMLSAKYGAAAVNSNPHDLLLKSLWLTPRSVSIQKLFN
jgi:hypothetical protein